MKVLKLRQAGFTLVEIMIVVAIVGLLAAITTPGFVRARETSWTRACVNNLRQIDAAKDQYAMEQGLTTGATLPNGIGDLMEYIRRQVPVCPVEETPYILNAIGTTPECASTLADEHNKVWKAL